MHNDLLVNDVYAPVLEQGDFIVDVCVVQHVSNILQATPGMYKQSPTCGVGVNRYLNGPITLKEIIEVKTGLKAWGYHIEIDQSFQNFTINISDE